VACGAAGSIDLSSNDATYGDVPPEKRESPASIQRHIHNRNVHSSHATAPWQFHGFRHWASALNEQQGSRTVQKKQQQKQ
jgi:hypothetical protein